jgi:hypothetical protein
MIAKWLTGERFVTTTPRAKPVPLRILAPKRNNQELESFD